MQTEYELFRCNPLFLQNNTPSANPHDRWGQYGDALPSSDYMGFEGILNRIYPERKRLDYHPFYGPSSGSGTGGESTEEITLSPEPWPQENTTVLQASVAAAQPALQPTPNPKPAPSTTLPRRPPANDPVFNVKKGIRLTRVLGGIAGVILGVFIPDNASLEEEWEVDGVNYKYNTDDFSLEITSPDGSKEQVIMYPDGTVTDQQGAILGSAGKDGAFTPATEQEEVDFRVWKANGGEDSFAVWKNSGKPVDVMAKTGQLPKKKSESYEGTYKGDKVILNNIEVRKVKYTKSDRTELKTLRSEFNNGKRQAFVKGISNDSKKITMLKKAGLKDNEIDMLKNGDIPIGWQVHHKLPLDDGGTNNTSNLVLIRNAPEHSVLTTAQKRLTKGMEVGDTRTVDFPVPNGFVYPVE